MINEKEYNRIFGNNAIKSALRGFTERGAFPHALIFSGPEGSGKTMFAYMAAKSISCTGKNKPCGECEACTKIEKRISPDIIEVGTQKDRKTIGVEAVRQIRETVYMVPNDLSGKIYIISDADKMTVQAQNALLKLFEEPPAGVYFFLLCGSVQGLLTTVRSRAPELHTEQFSEERLSEMLIQSSAEASALKDSDPDKYRRILHLSCGSYGKAMELIGEKKSKSLDGFGTAEKIIAGLSGSDRAEFLITLVSYTSSRDGIVEVLDRLMTAVRDMTAVKRTDSTELPLLFYPSVKAARESAGRFSIGALMKIYTILERYEEKISETNVNLMTGATVLGDELWEAK